ncbi:hypothetical protein BB561_001340 [Smittium simulii]|uniref:Protein phosphatase n=1 Tax=Smittium simulii TaxID=133385 RepID=A0A2T9YV61_9FUNG|nr:hypothetical protein BB561_001340 [Smittium simulii]
MYKNKSNNTAYLQLVSCLKSSGITFHLNQQTASTFRKYIHSKNHQTKNFKFLTGSFGIPKKSLTAKNKPLKSTTITPSLQKAYPLQNTLLDNSELSFNVGEDAYFVKSDALGIADGIGSWSQKLAADSALFSKRLLYNSHSEISRFDDIEDDLFTRYTEATPVEVLSNAFNTTLVNMAQLGLSGSSTVCLALLRNDELRVANLGDSGLTIIRDGDMVFHTDEQQHSFNYPYQLSTMKNSDNVNDAQVFRIKVKKGDLIILGSDGVYDNLFDEDIIDVTNQFLLSKSQNTITSSEQHINNKVLIKNLEYKIDLNVLSKALAKRAYKVSIDSECTETPFQLRAVHEGLYYHGGKADDITVVSAIVVDLEDSPNRR